MIRSARWVMVAAAVCLLDGLSFAENWPQWRGPRNDGVSSETGLPSEWNRMQNVLWRAPLPGQAGATPVVWDDQVLLHTHGGVRAIDLETGQLVWQVDADSTGVTTPVIGDNRLFVATWNNLGEPSLRPDYPSFTTLLEHDSNGDGMIDTNVVQDGIGGNAGQLQRVPA